MMHPSPVGAQIKLMREAAMNKIRDLALISVATVNMYRSAELAIYFWGDIHPGMSLITIWFHVGSAIALALLAALNLLIGTCVILGEVD